MTPRARRLVAPLAVGGAALAGVAFIGVVDPNEPGLYPPCPTRALTGLDCPGCGGLRCVHALARGDIIGALDHNALAVLVLIPLAVVVWAMWLRREWRGPQPPALEDLEQLDDAGAAGGGGVATAVAAPPTTATTTWVWALVLVMAGFTVARNVGSVPWLEWLGSAAS